MFHVKHRNLGQVISIANQKGGVGKTTSTINLAASLAMLGKRVLVMDLDPQGNTTSGLGLDKNNISAGMYELLQGNITLHDAIEKSEFTGLDVIPTNMNLAGAEVEMVNEEEREYQLHSAFLDYDGKAYDYIFIDCPPALNLLTINALATSDEVLITLQTEFYALEGLSQLIDTIRRIRKSMNEKLTLGGILLTMVDKRNNLSQQVEQEAREYFGQQVFKQVIPRNVRLSEAPSYGLPALHHDARSTGAQAYLQAAQELIQRHGG